MALIALGRSAGFSLEEIAGMFAPDGKVRIDRQKLAAKAKELDATIRQLTAMRDGLRHAVACKAPSHMECPKFRRIVRVAASSVIAERRRAHPIARARTNKRGVAPGVASLAVPKAASVRVSGTVRPSADD